MTPCEYLDGIVRPNIDDFRSNYGSLRHAHNAISAMDALAAHIFFYRKDKELLNTGDSTMSDSQYREKLALCNKDFELVRDIAKAQKHVRLERGKPRVKEATQIRPQSIGWGEGPWGEGRYGGVEQVVVNIGNDSFSFVESIVENSLTFLEGHMRELGICSD